MMKTPLRYPGGKSRATKKIAQFLPDLTKYKSYHEPFLGGGSVALYISQTYPHLDIWVSDLYKPLIEFWQTLASKGDELYNELIQLKYRHCDPASAKMLFLEAKEYLTRESSTLFDRSVSFYIINKCSFSGLTESSSFSSQASDKKTPEVQKKSMFSRFSKPSDKSNASSTKKFGFNKTTTSPLLERDGAQTTRVNNSDTKDSLLPKSHISSASSSKPESSSS